MTVTLLRLLAVVILAAFVIDRLANVTPMPPDEANRLWRDAIDQAYDSFGMPGQDDMRGKDDT